METEASHQHPKWGKPSLPAELVTEILSRLPVKCLLQCKCVSKYWLALISSPQFIKYHLRVSADNKDCAHHRLMKKDFYLPECYLKEYSVKSLLYEPVIVAFDLDYPCMPFSIVGSVNGLICFENEGKELFLWNPSIRKYKKLPDFRPELRGKCSFGFGFGYDEIHDDYKVFRFDHIYDGSRFFDANIYSLKDDSWRSIPCPQDKVGFVLSGMFVNGKLYWSTTSGRGLERGWNMISFDLADEKWRKVELPCYGEENGEFKLGVIESNLSMICNNPRTQVDVWVMKEYLVKESWTRMCTIKYHQDPNSLGFYHSFFCSSNRGEVLLIIGSTIMIYNQKDDSIRYPSFTNFEFSVLEEFYVDSLVCPFSTK